MRTATVRGIDVSNYQGYPNWTLIRASGVQFGIAKATEGLQYRDPTFAHNWHGMHHTGIVRGAYHMLHYDIDGAEQADYHHAYVRASGRYAENDFCMVDFERLPNMSVTNAVHCLVAFVERALYTLGKQVVLYMDKWLWQELGAPVIPVLTDRPLIIPAYQSYPPAPLTGWPVLSFWQNSESGTVPGITGHVDTDVFLGTHYQLMQVVKAPE